MSNINFKPQVSSSSSQKEFTFRSLTIGIILGIIFGVGNAYLGLKVGTTVSASIPAAVISMTLFRIFSKKTYLLENNMAQTVASVGEGLAAGVIFTSPALFILGEAPSISRLIVLSMLGGLLGILFMIPMRRYIIVEEHGKLPFPEGTACFEMLKSTSSSSKALIAALGLAIGSIFKVISQGLNVFKEIPTWTLNFFQKTQISIDCTPALMGVGYIIGPKVGSYVLFGGVLAWGVIIPLISMMATGDMPIYPAEIAIKDMSVDMIWSNYIRFIGCGTVATGGILSLAKIFPLIKKTLVCGFEELFGQQKMKISTKRTDKDISLRYLVLGSLAIILFLWLSPGLPMNFLTVLLLAILGFFFVAVTSITVGLVGSTSNPASGMTIVTLLITCLVFVALGWTEKMYLISALTMSIVVNVAITMASTTSQDLKTGFLAGATPRLQQIGEIIGILIPSCFIAITVYLLNEAYGLGSSQLPAPQGTLMALIAKGVISGSIPIDLVLIGVVIGLILALVRLPVLPIAIGLYLPLSLSTGIFAGSVIRIIAEKLNPSKEAADRGILAASGLVAGDACTGVVLALLIVLGKRLDQGTPVLSDIYSLIFYLLIGLGLLYICVKPPKILEK